MLSASLSAEQSVCEVASVCALQPRWSRCSRFLRLCKCMLASFYSCFFFSLHTPSSSSSYTFLLYFPFSSSLFSFNCTVVKIHFCQKICDEVEFGSCRRWLVFYLFHICYFRGEKSLLTFYYLSNMSDPLFYSCCI